MNDNPIRRGHIGGAWSFSVDLAGKVITYKKWYAICPKCGKMIKTTLHHYRGETRNSRKTAKDALHYHLKVEHR